jgi:hypothetical protein
LIKWLLDKIDHTIINGVGIRAAEHATRHAAYAALQATITAGTAAPPVDMPKVNPAACGRVKKNQLIENE